VKPEQRDAARAEKLFGLLSANDGAGNARFTEEELITFLPLVMKASGLELKDSETLRRLFERVGEYIGATPGDSDEALSLKLAAYYRAHPPSKSLQDAFAQFFRGEAGGLTADGFDALVRAPKPPSSATPIASKPVFDVTEHGSKKE
jgi:hypothetical protein